MLLDLYLAVDFFLFLDCILPGVHSGGEPVVARAALLLLVLWYTPSRAALYSPTKQPLLRPVLWQTLQQGILYLLPIVLTSQTNIKCQVTLLFLRSSSLWHHNPRPHRHRRYGRLRKKTKTNKQIQTNKTNTKILMITRDLRFSISFFTRLTDGDAHQHED